MPHNEHYFYLYTVRALESNGKRIMVLNFLSFSVARLTNRRMHTPYGESQNPPPSPINRIIIVSASDIIIAK